MSSGIDVCVFTVKTTVVVDTAEYIFRLLRLSPSVLPDDASDSERDKQHFDAMLTS